MFDQSCMRVDESCKIATGLHIVVARSAKWCKMADVREHFSDTAQEKSEANNVQIRVANVPE